MDREAQRVAPQGAEVSMLAPEIVRQIRGLAALKWGSKRIAEETGGARDREAVPAGRSGGGGAAPADRVDARRSGTEAGNRATRGVSAGECGGGPAPARGARHSSAPEDAAAGSNASSQGAAGGGGRDGALRDGARAPDADRLRGEAGDRRSGDGSGVPVRRS